MSEFLIDTIYRNHTVRIHGLDENPSGAPMILLLHGLGATCTSWPFQIPALTGEGMRVVAVDIPGFGQSTWEGRDWWTIPRITRVLVDAIKKLTHQTVWVMGISMGGTIALQMALDYPEMVERLILVNTFASLRPIRWNELTYFSRRMLLVTMRGLSAQAEFVAWRIFPHPDQGILREGMIDQIRQSDEKSYRRAMIGLGLFDVSQRLRQIQIPALVISGDCDTTVPLRQQNRLAKEIPGARQVMISGAGHGAPADHPTEFNQALLDFIRLKDSQAAD